MRLNFENVVCWNKLKVKYLSPFKFAFTLSEILLAIGVLGVIAALTIPVLIQKTNDKALQTAYQKARYTLANGYKLYMVRNELYNINELPLLKCNNDKNCYLDFHKEIFKSVDESIVDVLPKEYLKSDSSEMSPFSWDNIPFVFATQDGISYGILLDENLNTFSVVTDINTSKKPNTIKRDLFKFRISGYGLVTDISNELDNDDSKVCSIEHPENCKTYSECTSLANHTDNGDHYFIQSDSQECFKITPVANPDGGIDCDVDKLTTSCPAL